MLKNCEKIAKKCQKLAKISQFLKNKIIYTNKIIKKIKKLCKLLYAICFKESKELVYCDWVEILVLWAI